MMDSCSPRKLEPGFEQMYSMLSDLMTSTMKSEPVRSAVRTSAGEGVPTSASGDNAGGHGGGKKSEASDQRGHHDRPQAKQRGFEGGLTNVFAFEAQLVDVADQDDGGFDGNAEKGEQAEGAGNAERCVREFERDQSADRFGKDDAEGDGDREFEVAVKREKNQKDQENSERPDDIELRLGVQQFAVLAAPVKAVALWKIHFACDGLLAGLDDAFEIAPLDRKLDADVARIVFAIDERGAGRFLERGEFRQGNLLARRSGNEQVADFASVGAKLRVRAHNKVE